jgi:hypothetical protein
MTDDEQRDGGVLAGLPASRPQRRSRRRRDEGGATVEAPAPPASASASGAGRPDRRIAQPGQPAGTPPRSDRGEPPHRDQDGGGVVGTAVQAAGELANIGLTAGGQFVRGVLSRLPRP